MGIGYGDGIGVMCRNHRGFIEATVAAAKIGASALYLNTMFAGPQLVEVTHREAPKALVFDEEFSELLEEVDDRRRAGHRLDRRRDQGADARHADRGQRRVRPEAAARPSPLRHPHLGHDRDARRAPQRSSPDGLR